MGLHSLLKADSYSTTYSLTAITPSPVGVTTYFSEREIHLAVESGLRHHNYFGTMSKYTVVGQITDVRAETMYVTREELKLVTGPLWLYHDGGTGTLCSG